MAVSVGNIIANLDLRDKMSKKMEEVRRKFRKLGDQAKETGKKIDKFGEDMKKSGETARNVGLNMTAGLTLPIVALGTKALVSFGQFEEGMNRVRAILGPSASQQDFKDLTFLAKELGRTTRFTATESADAMGFFALAGFKTKEIMDALPGTLDLAAAGKMNVAAAADIAAKTLRGYGMQANEVGRISDVMAAAFTNANTDLTQLGDAMKFAGPIAKSAGIEFEDATAAMSLMADAGFQGSMGGTALRGAITRLLAPTKQTEKIMRQLGVVVTDSAGRLLSMDKIVAQLEPHAENTGAMMRMFGQRAGPALASLVGRGSEALVELREKLRNAGGTTERIAQIQMEGLKGAFIELQSATEGLWIAIGEQLSPTFEALIDDVKGLVTVIQNSAVPAFANLNAGTKKTVIALAGGIAVLGPLTAIFGQVALGAGAMAGGFALIGGAGATMASVALGAKVALVLLAKAIAVVGVAFVTYKITKWAADVSGASEAVYRLMGRLRGLTDAQMDATSSAILEAEALKGVATISERLETMLGSLGEMGMGPLTSAFYNLSRNGKLGREEMEQMADRAMELKASGEELHPILEQLVHETEAYKDAAYAAEQAQIKHNQAAAETAAQLEKVREAVHGAGFGAAREDLALLEATWRSLTGEERTNLAVATDIANQYKVIAERLGDDVSPELAHVSNLVIGATRDYNSAIKDLGTPVKLPTIENLPKHVREAFKIGEEWFTHIDTGFQSAIPPGGGIVGAALAPPPGFPEEMYGAGKVMGAKLKKGFRETLADVPQAVADAFTGGGGIGGALQAVGSMFGANIGGSLGAGLDKLFAGHEGGGMFGGLTKMLGGMMGPIGKAVGAFAGPLIGKIVKLFSGQTTTERIGEAVEKHWGRAISDGLRDTMAATADEIGSDWGGMMMHLSELFEEAGGVMAFGFDQAIAKTRDLFSAVDQGVLTTEQASQSFGQSFALIAQAMIDSGDVATREFRELLELHDEFGFNSAEVLEFIRQQSERTFTGIAAMIRPLADETGDLTTRFGENEDAISANAEEVARLTAKRDALTFGTEEWDAADRALNVTLQEGNELQRENAGLLDELRQKVLDNTGLLDAFGTVAVGAFGAAVQGGMSFVEAARMAEPGISAIDGAMTDLGITSDNVAFNHLRRWNELILNNETLVDSVDAFDDVLIGLSATGGLTAESLASMGEIGVDQFDRLIAAGFTEQEALLMMGDNIFALARAYEEMGIPIDADTQRLLDMAAANGMVDPGEQLDGWELVTLAIQELGTMLEGLITRIGQVPDADVGVAYSDPGHTPNIPNRVDVDIVYRGTRSGTHPPGGGVDGGREWESFQRGGAGDFGAGTPAMLHGPEAIIPLDNGAVPVELDGGAEGAEMVSELKALRMDLEQLPMHIRDAIITSQ